jgi:hypothetical protein
MLRTNYLHDYPTILDNTAEFLDKLLTVTAVIAMEAAASERTKKGRSKAAFLF